MEDKHSMTSDDGDERLLTIVDDLATVLDRHGATTLDVLICARQLSVSALRAIKADTPQADLHRIIDGIARDLRSALRAQPPPLGEA